VTLLSSQLPGQSEKNYGKSQNGWFSVSVGPSSEYKTDHEFHSGLSRFYSGTEAHLSTLYGPSKKRRKFYEKSFSFSGAKIRPKLKFRRSSVNWYAD
jgi:hypothetical protein